MDDTNDTPYKVSLMLTSLQEETIKALFAHNDWEYIKVGKYTFLYLSNWVILIITSVILIGQYCE